MVFIFAVWVTSSLHLSDLNFPDQTFPARCMGFTPEAVAQPVPALHQGTWCKVLIVLLAIFQKQSFSVLILETWGISIPVLVSLGQNLTRLSMSLDYMHMGSYLLICETQSLTYAWHLGGVSVCFKEAVFTWEGSVCLDFTGGIVTIQWYPYHHQLLYLPALNKRWH